MSRLKSVRLTNWLPLISLGLLVLLLLAMSLGVPSDPDMGWHLRNGQDILANLRLSSGDPYSWTMPTYPWVTHEWLSDALMAFLNNLGGAWAMIVFFALVISSAFYIVSGAVVTSRPIRLLVAIVGLAVSWSVIGVRPQMMTMLGIAILLYLLFNWRRQLNNTKWLYWLPVLFFVWANLHGGFPAGFGIIVVFAGGDILRHILIGKTRRRIPELLSWTNLLMLAKWVGISFLVTFINPDTWRVYLELYQTFSDRDILNAISEWLPVSLTKTGSYNLVVMIGLLFGLLIANRGRFDLTKLLLTLTFLIFGVTSWRHIPLFALTAMTLLTEQMTFLLEHGLAYQLRRPMIIGIIAMMVGLAGYWQISRIHQVVADPDLYGEVFHYPRGAVQYLKTHPVNQKRMLNEYNWGGYLIWQYPEQKVFIDGRMAIWKQDGMSIFKEFQQFAGNNPSEIATALKRWDIDMLLVDSERAINAVVAGLPDQWSRVYADSIASVWVRQVPVSPNP